MQNDSTPADPDHPSHPGHQDYPETDIRSEPMEMSHDDPARMSKESKKRILGVLFGRLIRMHKNVMNTFAAIHAVVIVFACCHIFTLGTVDSEKNACYMTWPLAHLYYAFLNYLFAWFFCYNSFEIEQKDSANVVLVSKKFLKIVLLISPTPLALKMLSDNFCRNWTISYNVVMFQFLHVLVESVFAFFYFAWFERKFTGFRIFYRESII